MSSLCDSIDSADFPSIAISAAGFLVITAEATVWLVIANSFSLLRIGLEGFFLKS
jgi:hypothetical protein